jgi:hypothetical protein
MIRPGKKCIAKKCEDCNFYDDWYVEDKKDGRPTGLKKNINKCSFRVLFEELPMIRGAIDGLQGGVNEARNRSAESKEVVERFGTACKSAFSFINKKLIGD